MHRKLYKYRYSLLILVSILMITVIGIVCLVCSIIFRETGDFVALLICGIVITIVGSILFIVYFVGGAFTPIYFTETGIKKGKSVIDWKDIKITLYPPPSRGLYCYYFLIADRQYITELPTLKFATKHGIAIRLSKKALDVILPYYQSKLLVLNCYGDCDSMKATHKINFIVNQFNDNIVESNGTMAGARV